MANEELLKTFIDQWKSPAKTNMYKLVFKNAGSLEGAATTELSRLLGVRAKGAQLPTSDIGVLEIPYKGRKVKMPAERQFAEWTVTIMETAQMEVRKAMERWMSQMDAEDRIVRDTNAICDIEVHLLQGDNATDAIVYTLYGAFPSSLASVDLSFDEQTAPLEYSVTFQYGYHTVSK